ncbi:MAG: hypothetical protein SA339_00385 [Methanomassiliicoccus sp.]|nr:hypothetical protein [Methanomassiliicoccus sp.]
MIAHILLEYSSDGPPPSTVDRRIQGMGLSRDGAYLVLEAATEEELNRKIDRLHEALRGSGVRYTIAAGRSRGEAAEETEVALEPEPRGVVLEGVLLEAKADEAIHLLRRKDMGFDDLLDALDLGEDELEMVLRELVGAGLITVHRTDDGINYRLAGPMLRSLAR